MPTTIVLAHTADLAPSDLHAGRALLYDVFDDMTEADWEHCLGGVHAIARGDEGAVVGHASLVMRRLFHGGRALRTGYVEGVAVRAAHRRRADLRLSRWRVLVGPGRRRAAIHAKVTHPGFSGNVTCPRVNDR